MNQTGRFVYPKVSEDEALILKSLLISDSRVTCLPNMLVSKSVRTGVNIPLHYDIVCTSTDVNRRTLSWPNTSKLSECLQLVLMQKFTWISNRMHEVAVRSNHTYHGKYYGTARASTPLFASPSPSQTRTSIVKKTITTKVVPARASITSDQEFIGNSTDSNNISEYNSQHEIVPAARRYR